MKPAGLAVACNDRIRREECKRTKHDSLFSKWLVLVGPSDWKDHSLGKEGADRYRVHNLPPSPGPGLYELGIIRLRNGFGRQADKLDSDDVLVVYLGQADNVRTRLQFYGRSGAHLNNTNDGPGCFDVIFSNGYSIVYRWSPAKNKEAAVKKECELLKKYDYAWNKGCNGARRLDDVLQKPNKGASNHIQYPKTLRKLLYFSQKPVGIKIKASMYADEESHFFSEILKFSKSRPRLVLDKRCADENYTSSCGVSLGDGSVCRRPPVEGRKRCSQHKGLRISVSIPMNPPIVVGEKGGSRVSGSNPLNLPTVVGEKKCPVSEGFSSICGVVSDDGNLCRRPPVQGNKRCEEHKWRKMNGSNSKSTGTSQYVHVPVFDSNSPSALNSPEMYRPGRVQPRVSSESPATKLPFNTICGVELGDETFCTRQPVKGRVRCEEHKGQKVNGIKYKSAAQTESHVYDAGSNFSTFNGKDYCNSVCGAKTLSGTCCSRRPAKGNTRCWQHSKPVLDKRTISSFNDWNYEGSSVCGAPTRSGSYCRRSVRGGGRCYQH